MATIRFTGWNVGMQKIPFIKLLNEKANLSLTLSKEIKDRIVDNAEIVEISINDLHLAEEIVNSAKGYGVLCELVE
jgi:siroheme synthase (precorrin-2 oxidase/ferrochelatase)